MLYGKTRSIMKKKKKKKNKTGKWKVRTTTAITADFAFLGSQKWFSYWLANSCFTLMFIDFNYALYAKTLLNVIFPQGIP